MTTQLDTSTIPNRIWFVNSGNDIKGQWPSRRLARVQKRELIAAGNTANISFSLVTIEKPIVDSHS